MDRIRNISWIFSDERKFFLVKILRGESARERRELFSVLRVFHPPQVSTRKEWESDSWDVNIFSWLTLAYNALDENDLRYVSIACAVIRNEK